MRILSGCQPTGSLHLGNYLGAVRQWIDLQDKGEGFYFIANYHALTSIHDPEELTQRCYDWTLDLLALGLDPDKAILFLQTDVPEVTELTWIFSCVTSMGLLQRCHSYKDKVAKGVTPSHGLFAYPVLMAADILAYRSHKVPVGQDQKQHLEVTRDIATRFNQTFGEIFPLPDEVIVENTATVPGVDGQKMSGSYGNYIPIFEKEKKIRKIIMSIVTDSKEMHEPKEPEGNTIYELYKLLATPEQSEALAARFREPGMGYGHAKQELFEVFMERFRPAHERRAEYEAKPDLVREILDAGAKRARAEAQETLGLVREATGLRWKS